jgi:hypothetical protein
MSDFVLARSRVKCLRHFGGDGPTQNRGWDAHASSDSQTLRTMSRHAYPATNKNHRLTKSFKTIVLIDRL